MFAAGAAVASVGAAAYARYGRRSSANADDSEAVVVDAADAQVETHDKPATWKESAGRTSGGDGYVFGDLTRGVCVRVFGKSDPAEHEAELAGDEQNSHVQVLLQEAIEVFRARGYNGTINLSQTVAYFNESVSVAVKPLSPDVAPWEQKGADQLPPAAMPKGRAGRVFATLISRLERRARSWQAFSSGIEGVDPNLSQSAHIGFAIPVVKIGWGVSVSLTVSASSLLRWADYAAKLETHIETTESAASVEGLEVDAEKLRDEETVKDVPGETATEDVSGS